MATSFKSFLANDTCVTKQLLHEAIPLTGSLLSGTYGAFLTAETNIKNYSHGMFSTAYDYPYLSSSSNRLLDISVGYAASSQLSKSSNLYQQEKKINLYNQMAQLLMGYDHTGSIQMFDEDGDIYAGGTKMREVFILSFSRLLVKDEIKKGSFSMQVGSQTAFANANWPVLTINDAHAANDFRVNSPAGEYAILTASAGFAAGPQSVCGLLFYQAGIAILTASIFTAQPNGLIATDANFADLAFGANLGPQTVYETISGSQISSSADFLRHRIYNISFNNTTELNSTIYFVRANHNEFNYSANPTYLSSSRIRVKNNTYDQPIAYLTTVGLYSADNELLAIGKLSEPLKKTPDTELTLRVRLDY